jgi:hypothetical protein
MSKRMYYSEAEATEKLMVGADELAVMVRDQKLRVYMDGSKKMYRAEEVDALVPPSPEIELSPADTSDSISLSEVDTPAPTKAKEDTVITAEGISIFDHEDLEVESADPMAKTQIAPSVEDQASIDGTGSGSGLLDLTRESDETSLGAEVLDHIDIEGAVGSGLESEIPEPAAPTPAQEMVMVVEQAPDTLDAGSGLYNGIVIGSTVIMLVLSAVMISAMNNVLPDYVSGMKDNMAIVLAVFVVLAGITAAVGYMMGKAVARQTAMKNTTGQGTAS